MRLRRNLGLKSSRSITSALSHKRHERLLRRADWRFLLPSARPAKSICFCEGQLAEAVRAISESVVDLPPDRSNGDCDLAVATDPGPSMLLRAWSALRPGGWCYTECYSLSRRGVLAAERRLRRAGFECVTSYWPRPDPSRAPARTWIPLRAPGALAYYRTGGTGRASSLGRLGRAAGEVKWSLARALRLRVPVCVLGRKPAATSGDSEAPGQAGHAHLDGPAMGPGLPDAVRRGWAAWGLGIVPNEVSVLLLTGGWRSKSKIVSLCFAEPDPRPRLVLKAGRTTEATRALLRESECLRAVEARFPGMPGVPRVLFSSSETDAPLFAQTVVTGVPLRAMLRRENYRESALKVTEWLVDLATRTASEAERGTWPSRFVQPVVAEFAAAFGGLVDAGLLKEALGMLEALPPTPIVCEQGDVSPENVVVMPGGDVALLDWEAAELEGLPGLDLLYFLIYSAFELDGAWTRRRLRSYGTMLDPASLSGRVTEECLDLYAGRVAISRSSLRTLRLFLWMRRALWSHGRRALGEARRDHWDRTLCLRLWEEDVRRAA